MVGDIANTTCLDAVLASEEHQHVAIDARTADRAALDVVLGSKYFLNRRHAAGYLMRKTKPPSGVHSPDGFAMLGPDRDYIRCRQHYRFRFPSQRNSLVKLDAGVAG
jgi:hypothetical protein